MKKILIISPYFPPYNTPDMQRLRMSVPYYSKFDWDAEIITVQEPDIDTPIDLKLSESIPKNLKIHYIKCLPKKLTMKIGLGSIAYRSLYFYFKKVNNLLKKGDYDLIFFTTTQFPLCVLGSYWKKKFNVPFIIDVQDPWHTDYYLNKPKNQRPKKYWISYYLNKYLEPIAMKQVDGIISVSNEYIDSLRTRYFNVQKIPSKVITFGYSKLDLLLSKKVQKVQIFNKKQLSYVGVIGPMMKKSLNIFFKAASKLSFFSAEYFMHFEGTSYSNPSFYKPIVTPIANSYGLNNLKESPDRMGTFEMLSFLSNSHGLVIFGTDHEGYTSSKLYPYIQSGSPILGIFHSNSSAIEILKRTTNANIISLDDSDEQIFETLKAFLIQIETNTYQVNMNEFSKYSAVRMTENQCTFFNEVIISK